MFAVLFSPLHCCPFTVVTFERYLYKNLDSCRINDTCFICVYSLNLKYKDTLKYHLPCFPFLYISKSVRKVEIQLKMKVMGQRMLFFT
jgi:hypothetical protein